jgi:2-amino-4-hydroxy-6-hydroxymethyldihydropteridine diphosphokinase
VTSVLSLGSNLGDRFGFLRLGLSFLDPLAVSAVYETAPWGGVEQEDYLNVVALCAWDAAEAWRRAVAAETAAGRVRDVHWGPRTLDVDVVWADGSDPALSLPHPHAHERAFVLVPWLDVDPLAVLPGHGPVASLPVDRSSVRLVGALA